MAGSSDKVLRHSSDADGDLRETADWVQGGVTYALSQALLRF